MPNEYKYVIGGDSIQEVANQFAELVAAKGRMWITTNKGNASKRYGKWAPTKDAEQGRAPSLTLELPEFTVNGLQPESAHITVLFSNLKTAQSVKKFREEKAATITARLQKDLAAAQRLGIKIPGMETIATDIAPVDEEPSTGSEVVDGE